MVAPFDGGLVLEKVSDFISEKRKALFVEETAVRDAVRAYYFEQREYEDEVRECYVVGPDDPLDRIVRTASVYFAWQECKRDVDLLWAFLRAPVSHRYRAYTVREPYIDKDRIPWIPFHPWEKPLPDRLSFDEDRNPYWRDLDGVCEYLDWGSDGPVDTSGLDQLVYFNWSSSDESDLNSGD